MFLPVGDDIRTRRRPIINVLLILANVAAFGWWAIRMDYPIVVSQHGLVPAHWTWSALITSMFLHADLMHLCGNMLFLAVAGDNIEDRYGHGSYPVFYGLSGLAAGFAHIAFCPAGMSEVPTIGASGAVSGVLGAYLALFPFQPIRLLVFVVTIRVPVVLYLAAWVALQWMMMLGQQRGEPVSVAVAAHLGGFVFGFSVTLLMRLAGRLGPGRRKARH